MQLFKLQQTRYSSKAKTIHATQSHQDNVMLETDDRRLCLLNVANIRACHLEHTDHAHQDVDEKHEISASTAAMKKILLIWKQRGEQIRR